MRACLSEHCRTPLKANLSLHTCGFIGRRAPPFCCAARIAFARVDLPQKHVTHERINAHKPMQNGSFFSFTCASDQACSKSAIFYTGKTIIKKLSHCGK